MKEGWIFSFFLGHFFNLFIDLIDFLICFPILSNTHWIMYFLVSIPSWEL